MAAPMASTPDPSLRSLIGPTPPAHSVGRLKPRSGGAGTILRGKPKTLGSRCLADAPIPQPEIPPVEAGLPATG